MFILRFIFGKIAFLFLLAGLALTGFAVDYTLQMMASGKKDFGTAHYVRSLQDRLQDKGGWLSIAFRKSSRIAGLMPAAPDGWQGELGNDGADWFLYSDAQNAVLDRIFYQIVDTDLLETLSNAEIVLMEGYIADTTATYMMGENMVVLTVYEPTKPVNNPTLRGMFDDWERAWDDLDTEHPFAQFQDIAWQEVKGPVDAADNGARPHKLRFFEARIDHVELELSTRASPEALTQFLAEIDWRGLRHLAADGASELQEQVAGSVVTQ
ncbi:hypothetical protein PGB28_07090 [Primorskyibacter aestuariivivens]|uniref:hypothetical protein n=1 Tax=Primorskyibacter aestuariivivens TaxID=1888912 RepID=UPI0022FFD22D|nr:hypothetical protein [Primorskyibacter aestuariivivens]MDA7428218.1 hypothetical protein [Primorskyibacter aestuariivivens]